MDTALITALAVALAVVVSVLTVGILGLRRGGATPHRSQRLMRARIAAQVVAIVIVVGLVALRWWKAN